MLRGSMLLSILPMATAVPRVIAVRNSDFTGSSIWADSLARVSLHVASGQETREQNVPEAVDLRPNLNLSSLQRGLNAESRFSTDPPPKIANQFEKLGTLQRAFNRHWGRSVGKRRVHTRVPGRI